MNSLLNALKKTAKAAKSASEKENMLHKYLSHFHPIKFPYITFQNAAQKEIVPLVLKQFFLTKQVNSFFKSDSILLCRFFYKIAPEDLAVVIPSKVITFIRPIEAKRTGPKRIVFHQFILLEKEEKIFIRATLHPKRRAGPAISYVAEYRKKKNGWRLKYIRKLKEINSFYL